MPEWFEVWQPILIAAGAGLFWVWQRFAIGEMVQKRLDFSYREKEDQREYLQQIEAQQVEANLKIQNKQIEAALTQKSYESDMVMSLLASQIEFNNEMMKKVIDDISNDVKTIQITTRTTSADVDLLQRYLFDDTQKGNTND